MSVSTQIHKRKKGQGAKPLGCSPQAWVRTRTNAVIPRRGGEGRRLHTRGQVPEAAEGRRSPGLKKTPRKSFLTRSAISVLHKSRTSHAEPPMIGMHMFRLVFQERARESPRTVGALLLIAMN